MGTHAGPATVAAHAAPGLQSPGDTHPPQRPRRQRPNGHCGSLSLAQGQPSAATGLGGFGAGAGAVGGVGGGASRVGYGGGTISGVRRSGGSFIGHAEAPSRSNSAASLRVEQAIAVAYNSL